MNQHNINIVAIKIPICSAYVCVMYAENFLNRKILHIPYFILNIYLALIVSLLKINQTVEQYVIIIPHIYLKIHSLNKWLVLFKLAITIVTTIASWDNILLPSSVKDNQRCSTARNYKNSFGMVSFSMNLNIWVCIDDTIPINEE